MKTCTKCKETKSVSEFGPSSKASDGLNWYCRPCMAEAQRASYRRHLEAARKRKREAQWLKLQDPTARERKRAADRRAYSKNPDVWKEGARRRRARQQEAPIGYFTPRDWRRIVDRQRGECFYCGSRAELVREHLTPLARGGAHSVGNIVGACVHCNCQKRTKTRMEYRVWLAARKSVAA